MAGERGLTIVELLVALLIFAVLSGTFYSVLLSGVSGSETARNVARVSEEARLGFNRIIRDTREATEISAAAEDGTSYTIKIDFNRDGDTDDAGEQETFSFDGGRILLEGEVLIAGVSPQAGSEIFTFSTNFLEYDTNGDGVATWEEIDAVEDGRQGDLDDAELPFISNVTYRLNIRQEDREEDFFAEVQLRNRR